MKSDPQDAVRTFATFRIAGDRLEPDAITKILRVIPTRAYAKGQSYSGGSRSPNLVGKTGVWYLSTDQVLASRRLDQHLGLLAWMLVPGVANILPLTDLIHLIRRKNLKATVTCFWNGPFGTKKPSVPRSFIEMLKLIPAEIETDFDTDEKSRQVA
jgi:hypothetical protein